MSPVHKHSASLPAPPAPELYPSNSGGGGSIDFSLLNHSYPHHPVQPAVGGMRYYPHPVGALQLPNGEYVPYEMDTRVDVAQHPMMHPGQMMHPGAAYYGGPPPPERHPSFESNGKMDMESRGRGGNKRGSRHSGAGRGGSRRSRGVQKELRDNVKRTVYISDIDQHVTEEELANMFADSGSVVDCRVCGDPNSAKRFAFIEFSDEAGASKALEKTGTVLGTSTIRVLPSKTAIVPVNKDFMPRNMEEMELCSRTVYVANIDKKVDKHDVRRFFDSLCGKVTKLRLLGDYAHSTRIAFIEFTHADSALAALNCTGAVLGTLPIRVSPSKAPVRMCSTSDCED